MLNIKKVTGLLLVLFGASSCSCHTKTNVVVPGSGTTINEDNNKDKYGGSSPELAYYNLKLLANREFADIKKIENPTNYVENLVSLEYLSEKVTYCASAGYDGSMYLLKITLNHSFIEDDEFIYNMSTLNLSTAHGTYGVSFDAMRMIFDENIGNKFDDKMHDTLPNFDENKVYNRCNYKIGDDYYFAITYHGTDSGIYSINEIRYNSDLDNFQFSSGYSVVGTSVNKMYSLLEMILA